MRGKMLTSTLSLEVAKPSVAECGQAQTIASIWGRVIVESGSVPRESKRREGERIGKKKKKKKRGGACSIFMTPPPTPLYPSPPLPWPLPSLSPGPPSFSYQRNFSPLDGGGALLITACARSEGGEGFVSVVGEGGVNFFPP